MRPYQKKAVSEAKNHSENKIQQDIFVWYNNNYCLKNHNPRCLIAAIPNGGNVSVQNRMTLLATGMLPGFSDLIVVHKSRCVIGSYIYFVEVKKPGEDQKQNQKEFEDRVELLGFRYVIVKSLEEFKDFILYGTIPNYR